jgi:LDH2 family malate/lactate/ureidoglycolate dehydrogenase
VGAAHLVDLLDAIECGRINDTSRPVVVHDRRSVVMVSADDGIAFSWHARCC